MALRRYCPETALGRLRQAMGLSQYDLAVDVDLAQSAYRKLELGLSRPKVETMLRLSETLGVSPHELFPDGEHEQIVERMKGQALACTMKEIRVRNGEEKRGTVVPDARMPIARAHALSVSQRKESISRSVLLPL